MTGAVTVERLPLRTRTSRAWAACALADETALLEDHAHLEKKAAQNALTLMGRWPGGAAATETDAALRWSRRLTRVARDEIEHLGLVLGLLEARGHALGRHHKNPYAAALRGLVREGDAEGELVDRLLVSALIEARSCERFERLSEASTDEGLRRLYRGLLASERGHFRIFLDLAAGLPGRPPWEARWGALLDAEAAILAAQAPGPRMHAGEPAGAV